MSAQPHEAEVLLSASRPVCLSCSSEDLRSYAIKSSVLSSRLRKLCVYNEKVAARDSLLRIAGPRCPKRCNALVLSQTSKSRGDADSGCAIAAVSCRCEQTKKHGCLCQLSGGADIRPAPSVRPLEHLGFSGSRAPARTEGPTHKCHAGGQSYEANFDVVDIDRLNGSGSLNRNAKRQKGLPTDGHPLLPRPQRTS